MTKTEIKNTIQHYVDNFGLGISKEALVDKVYWFMYNLKYDVCVINGRYLDVNGNEYQFIKSKKNYRWIVKEF